MNALKTAAKACLRTILEAAGVVVLMSLLGFCLAGCSGSPRLADGTSCERIPVSGEVSYVVAYMKDDGWYLSAPGEGASTVHEGQVLTLDHDARMGVIAFLDSKGRVTARAHNWNERGPQRKFCLE